MQKVIWEQKDSLKNLPEYAVALVFLVHDGNIQYRQGWLDWKNELREDSRDRLQFFAICSVPIKGWHHIPLTFDTDWGTMSIVNATMLGFKAIVEADFMQKITCFYLLSGSHVPLVAADEIAYGTCENQICNPFYLFPKDHKYLKNFTEEEEKILQTHAISGNQWTVWNRKTIETLLSLYFGDTKEKKLLDRVLIQFRESKAKIPEQLEELTKKDQELAALKGSMKRDSDRNLITLLQQDIQRHIKRLKTPGYKSYRMVPDEWYIQTLANLSNQSWFKGCPTYVKFPRNKIYKSLSPFTWDSWENTYSTPDQKTSDTFSTFLQSACENEDALFLRKVAIGEKDPKFPGKPWIGCMMPQDPTNYLYRYCK